ncbi:MAG: hypothetical protein GX654_17850 [Desulfatiglans sp.]|jgi:uncharacterized protein YdhG (YjbR/CyaY superfamily)|nr:hypothetical protein [Desulfatiglans sp.]
MVKKKISHIEIDRYISNFPKDVQGILKKIRDIISKAAPDADEAIKYGIPTFVLNENLIHFAGYKRHIGFYPTPSAIEKFRDELSEYEKSKGSIKFPLDKPVPYDLIKKIVKYRVGEVKGSL